MLQSEVAQWKGAVEGVTRTAHKIAADCPHDDANRLRAIADRINQRYTELFIRYFIVLVIHPYFQLVCEIYERFFRF